MKKAVMITLILFAASIIAIFVGGYLSSGGGASVNPQSKKLSNESSQYTPNGNVSAAIQPGHPKTFSLAEVSNHNMKSDCWMAIEGKVYDITPFIGKHPGGNGAMVRHCGTDASAAYETKDAGPDYDHSNQARAMLGDYLMGKLK